MVTITIPLIPSFMAILAFTMLPFMEIDKSDRIIVFVLSGMLSTITFFASYGFFTMQGVI